MFGSYEVSPGLVWELRSMRNVEIIGLSEWRNEKGWLTDTCLDGQDIFVRLLDMLEIPYDRD